ncbi:MAG: fatty acid desaturase [Deltaproteobacteria bacterium]|nr:fatty acid desaturase [Deltaproteobacteria bacterium]
MSKTIYFCDRPTKVALVEIKDLSAEKRQAIRDLHRVEDWRNVRALLFFAIYAAGAWAAWMADHLIIQVIGSLGIVCAMVGLTVLLHEASHGLLLKRPVLNDLLGFLCGLPVLLPVSAFRTNHKGHHARRSSRATPDDVAFPRLEKARSGLGYFLAFLAKAFAFITVLPASSVIKADWKTRFQTISEYSFVITVYALLFRFFPFAGMWKLWLLPLLIGAFLTQVRAIAEHGLTTRGNVFTATRTVVSNRVVSFMMCNINYHLEHHLFPGVPWYNLPKVHELLQDECRRAGSSTYRSYTEFFLDFFKAISAGLIPNARLLSVDARRALSH